MKPASASRSSGSASAAFAFLLSGCLWVALLGLLANTLLGGSLWQILVAVLFTGLPLALLLWHQATVHSILRRQRFRPDSLFFRWYSGRLMGLLLAIVYGFCTALFLLLRLHVAQWSQWLLLLLAVPLFHLCCRLLESRLFVQMKPWVLQDVVLRWSRVLCAVLLASLALGWRLLEEVPAQTLLESVEAQRAAVAGLQGSVALQQFALWWQSWEGVKQFVLAGLVTNGMSDAIPSAWSWYLLVAWLEEWMLFYLLGLGLGCFKLGANEWRRTLAPLTDAEQVAAPGRGRLVLFGGVGSFLLLFVLLPFAAYTELWARSQQAVLESSDRQLVLQLERIGDAWYAPGTWDSLRDLRTSVLDELALDRQELEDEVNRAFDLMDANLDAFLDWYYSLGAEYLRLASLLSGNLESLMEERLREFLQRGDAFARVEQVLQLSLAGQEELQARYQVEASAVLAAARVEPGQAEVLPVRELSLDSVLTPPVHEELLTLQSRLLVGTGGGAVAGVMTSAVSAKLASRMLAKGSVKLAGKALAKLVASKAGGAGLGIGAGAAAGAAAGSVVPGFGTAVGAVIGGVAGGILAGVGIDKALIEFEESVSRESFKAELSEALEEARAEFLQGLHPQGQQ